MKLVLYLSLLFSLIIYGDKSFSLNNYEIKKICKKEKKELICIKNLKEKKSNLKKGNLINIPVIPYRR